jgi:hypothetical protein
MKRLIAGAAAVLLALALAGPVAAVPTSGKVVKGIDPGTGLTSQPVSGATFYVDASVHSITPVVPYEYAIRNECGVPGKPGSSAQQDDIVTWTSEDGNGDPHVTLPIYLQSVPSGSKCKVFLVRNGNVVVKGSTLSYTTG